MPSGEVTKLDVSRVVVAESAWQSHVLSLPLKRVNLNAPKGPPRRALALIFTGLALGGIVLFLMLLYRLIGIWAFGASALILSIGIYFHYRYYPPQSAKVDAWRWVLYFGLLFAPLAGLSLFIF